MEEIIVENKKAELSGLSIKDLFFKYLRFLPLFIISVALSLFVAYIYLRYATEIYRSTGTLIVEDDKTQRGSGDRFDQVLSAGGSKNLQTEIEVLKSRPLMQRVVTALNLNFSYYAKGKIKELNNYKENPFYIEAYSIADSSASFDLHIEFANQNNFYVNGDRTLVAAAMGFKNNFGVFKLVMRPGMTVNKEYRVNWSPTHRVAAALASQVVIAPKTTGTGILLLSLEATNASLAADVINQLMDEYSRYTLERKNTTNQQSKDFIDERVRVVSTEIDSINNLRISYMRTHNINDIESQSQEYMSNFTESNKAVIDQGIVLEQIRLIDDYLRNSKNSFDPVPSAFGVTDGTLSTMINLYNSAQIERKNLLDGGTPRENVLVKQKEEQIERLRRNIMESLNNLRSSIHTSIQSLNRQGSIAQSRIRDLPSKQQVLENIMRQQASKLSIYNFLMEKREETALAIAANIPNSKTLDHASPIRTPVKPNKQNIRLLSILIGVVLPALFIFVLELLNDKVTTRYDIERLTDAPILGEVGHSYGKKTLVVTNNNRSVVAEQFRIIRSNLQYVLNQMKQPVILVSSSFSGEGKSFISTNIGAVMALAGKKTIILEFDIRKPKILSQLDMPKKPGLTNYLLGKISVDQLAVPVPGIDNLFVLPCGPVPPNPAELLLDPKLNELFDYLKQNFDALIVDTAPVGMVSDAMTLSKFVDATLYIVRQGHTYKKQIGLIDEFHIQGKLPRISIILNDIKLRTGYGYYGYGRYGYGHGYGYGSGYFDEETPPPTMLEKWFGWLDIKKWKKKKRKKTVV